MRQHLLYIAIGALSFLAVTILERLAAGLEDVLLRTEIYGIRGFSHFFFWIGLASAILFFRPRASARIVILGVLLAVIAWEPHVTLRLSGEPLDPLCFNVSMVHTGSHRNPAVNGEIPNHHNWGRFRLIRKIPF